MNQTIKRWMCGSLVCAILLCSSGEAWARRGYSSGAYRQYVKLRQQSMKQQQQVMQMQQKAMKEAIVRQAAIEKQKRDNIAKASKARHDKEEQHRQEAIAKRKAEQAAKGTESPTVSKDK